jgi:hypothetical protein
MTQSCLTCRWRQRDNGEASNLWHLCTKQLSLLSDSEVLRANTPNGEIFVVLGGKMVALDHWCAGYEDAP